MIRHQTGRLQVIARRVAATAACGVLSACAAAPPPVVQPAAVPFERKMDWMLQLEDQRLLQVPEPPAPPPAPVVKGRKPPPPPPPAPRPDLAALVRDREPRVRRRAAIAIGRVGLKEGIPALTPLLTDADGDVRQAAAFALGLIGDKSAAASLLPLLSDAEPLVRGRAADALGLIDASDAAAAIGQMAAEYAKNPVVTGMAADDERSPAPAEAEAFKLALGALVRLRAYEPIAAAVLDAGGKPVTSWWPVAYALQRVGDPRAVPALKQLAAVQGRYTPAFAARGLGAGKDPSAGPILTGMLNVTARPREVVVQAIRAVGALGVTQAGPRLAEIAADVKMEGNLRIEAVAALGALKAVDQLPYVQDLITDDWPAMRAAALRAAAAIDPDSFTVTLSGLEIDRHWLVRSALAEVLASAPAEVAVERLTAMLQDEDRRVVPAVLRALAQVKAPTLGAVLLAHLKDPDFAVREAAASLVPAAKPDGAVAALREAYAAGQPDTAYGARAGAIEALAELGGPEAIAGVREALADKDWAVRVRAVELLAKLEPSADHRLAIRPSPNTPPAPYDDPLLIAPPYSPHAFVETERGTIEIELAVLDAPQTARNFIALARRGFYNGLPVHRVVGNFVVQGGDPRGDGEGGPGYTIRDELNERPYLRGTVGMALSWRDSGGSQFFIMHSPHPHLDGRYTAFGHVVNGMDVVDRMQAGDVIQRVRVWDGKGWE